MEPFPVLISIPHGGYKTPEELKDRILLSKKDLFKDSDAFTQDIYDIGPAAFSVVTSDIARAFVDVNRSPSDLPPENPDGLIKSHTCHDKKIYKAGMEPDKELIRELLRKYYEPYYQKIRETFDGGTMALGFDCHSMENIGPSTARDAGQKRPMICLGNLHGETCPDKTVERLAECFIKAFELSRLEVTQNNPFYGQYIIKTFGNSPVPWIQVEMNRALYLKEPYFKKETLQIDATILHELNRKFKKALQLFFMRD